MTDSCMPVTMILEPMAGCDDMTVFEKIYAVVCQIPEGKVATYGLVALLAGNHQWARVVGYALHKNPAFGKIPCHRVVNREGRTAPSFAFGGGDVQRNMLENEGVMFLADGRVDMDACLWKPLRQKQ